MATPDVLAAGVGEVDSNGPTQPFRLVEARAVDNIRVEELRVASLHLDVDPGARVDVLYAEEEMILVLAVRIVVGVGLALVTPGNHHEANVFTSDWFEGRPDSDDGIREAEGKVDEILMQRVPSINVGRLIEIHAVHGNEVGPNQLFHLVQLCVWDLFVLRRDNRAPSNVNRTVDGSREDPDQCAS